MQPLDPVENRVRRNGQVKNAVGRQSARSLDLFQPGLEPAEAIGLADSGQIIQTGGEAVPAGVTYFGFRVPFDRLARVLPELIEWYRPAGASKDHGFVGQHAIAAGVE